MYLSVYCVIFTLPTPQPDHFVLKTTATKTKLKNMKLRSHGKKKKKLGGSYCEKNEAARR